MDDKPEGKWVPALTIGGEATVEQRKRNRRIYDRLKNGHETQDGIRDLPLHCMVFEIPADSARYTSDGMLAFRLDPDGECFRRLLSCIADAFDTGHEPDYAPAPEAASVPVPLSVEDLLREACDPSGPSLMVEMWIVDFSGEWRICARSTGDEDHRCERFYTAPTLADALAALLLAERTKGGDE